MWNYISGIGANAGQNLGDPPNDAGWPAYYQTPQFYELWINTDTLPKRNQFTDIMIGNGYTNNGKKIWIDAVEFTKALPNASDPNQLITDVLKVIFQIELSQASRDQLKKDFLLSGQDQDYYWTNAWNAYFFNPITANFNIVNPRLRGLFKYFMNLAEYQLA
jgi:pectate lyase